MTHRMNQTAFQRIIPTKVIEVSLFSGACTPASYVKTTHHQYDSTNTILWTNILRVAKNAMGARTYEEAIAMKKTVGGVIWTPEAGNVQAWCGVVEDVVEDAPERFIREAECYVAKCPLPSAIPGATAFQYKTQAHAIAATLTDTCGANRCKTRGQSGVIDPVEQARARAIVGARR